MIDTYTSKSALLRFRQELELRIFDITMQIEKENWEEASYWIQRTVDGIKGDAENLLEAIYDE